MRRLMGILVVGLVLGACASGANEEPTVASTADKTTSAELTTTSAPQPTTTTIASTTTIATTTTTVPVNEVGAEKRSGAATVTVMSAVAGPSVTVNTTMARQGSGYDEYADLPAGEGAKFVTIRVRVKNDGQTSMSLTCGLPIVNKLVDVQDREFDAIDELYDVKGNPGCGDSVQPGFTGEVSFVYRVPSDVVVAGWSFRDYELPTSSDGQFVRLVVSGA